MDIAVNNCGVTAPEPQVAELVPVCADSRVRSSLEVIRKLYNYNHWLFNKVRPFIRGSVCEVGSGIGNITQFLVNYERVVGIEPSLTSVRELREMFSAHSNVRFAHSYLADYLCSDVSPAAFDSVVCLNVLEHIEDDVAALDTMRRLCKPKGRVSILVPAHQMLYGELDRTFGHFRRYTKKTLARAFEQAGLRPTHSVYLNAIGFLGWLAESRIWKRSQISDRGARTMNRLVPFIDAVERLLPLPFGQSVVMIGTPTKA